MPGTSAKGPRVVNFANILKHDAVPFAEAIRGVLDVCSRSMGIPVEIEYAVNLAEPSGRPTLYLLQIKPLVQAGDQVSVDLSGVRDGDCVIRTEASMGNGLDATVQDLVFVKRGGFDREKTHDIALELASINASLKEENRGCVLVGFGRWGTRDPRLGIPVTFNQITQARAIVESDLPEFRVESSLGSHFFHNVTAMNIGYFSIPLGAPGSFVDWDWLESVPPFAETERCVHLRFDRPIAIAMDGARGRAAVLKPGTALTATSKHENIASCDDAPGSRH